MHGSISGPCASSIFFRCAFLCTTEDIMYFHHDHFLLTRPFPRPRSPICNTSYPTVSPRIYQMKSDSAVISSRVVAPTLQRPTSSSQRRYDTAINAGSDASSMANVDSNPRDRQARQHADKFHHFNTASPPPESIEASLPAGRVGSRYSISRAVVQMTLNSLCCIVCISLVILLILAIKRDVSILTACIIGGICLVAFVILMGIYIWVLRRSAKSVTSRESSSGYYGGIDAVDGIIEDDVSPLNGYHLGEDIEIEDPLYLDDTDQMNYHSMDTVKKTPTAS